MINGKQYGKSVSLEDNPSVQLNLSPGKYECLLNVIPKGIVRKLCEHR